MIPGIPESDETLLTGAEVAERFRVKKKTVWTWGRSGRISIVRTPSGRCRYREAEVRALMAGDSR